MQQYELIGGEKVYPHMSADNQTGGLTLSERLTRIENGQEETLRIVHDIELKGSQTAQAAMLATKELAIRVDHLERHTITADAVNSTLTQVANEARSARRWLVTTLIALGVLATMVISNFLAIHKITVG